MSCKCSVCDRVIDAPEDYASWPIVLDKQPGIYPITDNGKLDGDLVGFICAGCLASATKIRLDVKSLLSGVQVSRHAVERYLDRHVGEPITEESARISIVRIFSKAQPIAFRSSSYVARVQPNHTPSAYWFKQGWIFITTPEAPYTVKTMYFASQFNLKQGHHFDLVTR